MMENVRYDYSPIIKRKPLEWPNGARVALWVCPNIEYFHFDQSIPREPGTQIPNVSAYSLRDYGSRVGVFRLMDVFDKHGLRASVLLNAEVCKYQREIVEEGMKRNWEWLGHGLTNNMRMTQYALDEERTIIRQVKEIITETVGHQPKGWLGPGLAETFNTPDHLAAEGFEYVCDWGCDDQPVPMRVRTGKLIAVPYQQGINDISLFLDSRATPDEYFKILCNQFDVLYEEGATTGKVMAIPLHPYVTGLPFRIKALDRALEYICKHGGVWKVTGGEIADWFYKNCYTDPGPIES